MIDTLVVDDDPVVAAVLRRFVEQVPGFRVVQVAATGAQARTAVRDLNPRLVLLDLHLPDADGLDLAARLRRDQRELEIVIITSRRDLRTVRAAMHNGALHFLIKPVRLDVLRELLTRFLVLDRRLTAHHATNQAEVDQMFQMLHDNTPSRLPKGMTAQTLQAVQDTLQALHDCSTQEVADQLGISRPTAGRYLEYLSATGHALVHLTYGTRGRPQHRYVRVPVQET